eukprot:SAG22_NODE_15232_length_354_cov_0.525490_1_plen_41_part_10
MIRSISFNDTDDVQTVEPRTGRPKPVQLMAAAGLAGAGSSP